MLEIVAKRAALRPSDSGAHDISPPSLPPVSLPILPPSMTTQNPLQKMIASSNYNNNLPSISSTSSYHQYNTRPRQHHSNEEVSDDFFDGDMDLLSSVDSLMHEYNHLLKVYQDKHFSQYDRRCTFIAHSVLVLLEFIILYACILYYGYSQLKK
jgi:hypothetical protein